MMARWFFSILFLFNLLLTGCATRPPLPATRPLAQPCDDCLAGVTNFAQVSPVLWRGSQPTREGFRSLAAAGVKTVISFRLGADNSDEPLLAGTGLRYIQIPMKAWHPDENTLRQFLAVVAEASQDPHQYPIYVHCQQGRDRTGYSVASYRMVMQGWSANDAIQEMFNFRFNRLWRNNPRFLQQLNVEALQQSLKTEITK